MIRRVTMENFRYFSRKTIDFQNKPVILLSAANGVGKTTVADAIEWCLTGKIGRLKASYDTRSTNNTDRKNNAAGILKNRDVGKNDKVKVALTLIDGDQEIVLCREQDTDVLDPGKSIVTIDNDPEKAECFLRKHIGDDTQMESFYNFHFCDIQKSFNTSSSDKAINV